MVKTAPRNEKGEKTMLEVIIPVVLATILYLAIALVWFSVGAHFRDIRIIRIQREQEKMPEDPENEFPSDGTLWKWALLWPVWIVWYPILFALGYRSEETRKH